MDASKDIKTSRVKDMQGTRIGPAAGRSQVKIRVSLVSIPTSYDMIHYSNSCQSVPNVIDPSLLYNTLRRERTLALHADTLDTGSPPKLNLE